MPKMFFICADFEIKIMTTKEKRLCVILIKVVSRLIISTYDTLILYFHKLFIHLQKKKIRLYYYISQDKEIMIKLP
jgi:hypothetical protein